jgi:creatinine amidohydrolase
MMLRHPALVATDRFEVGYLGRINTEELFKRGLRAFTPNGIFGDPRRASPQIGEAVLEALVSYITDVVRQHTGTADR